jgi:flagellar basal body rod protein FlgG
MNPALWISKTRLDAQTKEIAVISNNLANAGTVGYKRAVRYLKTYFIKPLTNRVDVRRKIPKCHQG